MKKKFHPVNRFAPAGYPENPRARCDWCDHYLGFVEAMRKVHGPAITPEIKRELNQYERCAFQMRLDAQNELLRDGE